MNFPDVGKEKGSGGIESGLFLKLKNGDKIQGVFMGDPHIFKQHWIDGRSSLCVGKAECALCKAGDKPKFRFRINFITKVDGVWVAKVFEQAYGTYLDLKELHENDYRLDVTLVHLSRSGEGKGDTRYSIMPVKDNGGWKADNFEKLAKIPLNKFSEPEAQGGPTGAAGDEIPF